MIDIKLIRENPELVKENIRKKFQDEKIPMVDEVIALDQEVREVKQKGEALRADRNRMSKEIGGLMKNGQREEAEKIKAQVKERGTLLMELSLNVVSKEQAIAVCDKWAEKSDAVYCKVIETLLLDD